MRCTLQSSLACLALLLMASTVSATKVSLGPVQMGSGNWYELITDVVDYDTAVAEAASKTYNGMQGHLVTISSAEENEFVAKELGSFIRSWIAVTDRGEEGTFTYDAGPEMGQTVWTGGAPVGYAGFPAGEPNDDDGGEDAVEMTYWDGAWNDQADSDLNCYIVEYELIPEPTSMMGLAGAAALLLVRRKTR